MCKKNMLAVLVGIVVCFCSACTSAPSSETAGPTDSTGQGNAQSSQSQNTSTASQIPEFQKTVLVDNEDLSFQITAIKNDAVWGYTLKTQLENRTDKDLMFSLQDVSVNGYMCDPYFASTVTAGMKANKDISFNTLDFQEIGITDVTQVELTLLVYDTNDWTADAVLKETFRIYPRGQAADREYPRQSQSGDIVLFDTEDCTMIVTGFDPDNIWGYSVNVYLVNKTDDTLMFSVGDASVNGYMCSPYFAKTVAPGKQCITTVTWSQNALEENGITEVNELRLPIRVYDTEDWMDEEFINDTFTINP